LVSSILSWGKKWVGGGLKVGRNLRQCISEPLRTGGDRNSQNFDHPAGKRGTISEFLAQTCFYFLIQFKYFNILINLTSFFLNGTGSNARVVKFFRDESPNKVTEMATNCSIK
jgi:hypothetical protein